MSRRKANRRLRAALHRPEVLLCFQSRIIKSLDLRLLLSHAAQTPDLFDCSIARFAENRGQGSDPSVVFTYTSIGANIELTNSGISFEMHEFAGQPVGSPKLLLKSTEPGFTGRSGTWTSYFGRIVAIDGHDTRGIDVALLNDGSSGSCDTESGKSIGDLLKSENSATHLQISRI
jgi:hypothetical protein